MLLRIPGETYYDEQGRPFVEPARRWGSPVPEAAPVGECCEWCSEPETTAGELVEYDDGLGQGVSWVCMRCFDGARRFDVPGIDY